MPTGAGEVWLLDPGEIAGGGQRFGLRLAELLITRGLQVRIGCHRAGPLAGRAETAGIEVVDMGFPELVPWRSPAITASVARTRRFLRRLGSDALVAANHPRTHAYLYAATRARGPSAAVVCVAHEQETVARREARFVYRRFGSLLVVGQNAASAYRKRLPEVPVTKVNNFLPVGYFEQARQRQANPVSDEPSALGALARLIPEKGVLELVEELAAPEVLPLWGRLAVGGGFQDSGYAARVERRVGELGLGDRVNLAGELEDVPAFLRSIDALVVPSIGSEAQPTVILEALTHGLPVVAREPVYSADYKGLPIVPYATPRQLGAALRGLPSAHPPADELIRRFGPDQAIEAFERAAQLARARS